MAFVHQTIMDVNIATGALDPASNGIFAGLHADGIIPGLKNTVMNMYIGAGFHINAVTVLGIIGIADLHMLHGKALAEIGMNIPCRRVHERYALQKHLFAMAQADHHRAVKIIIGCRSRQCFFGGSLNVLVIALQNGLRRHPDLGLFRVQNMGAYFQKRLPLLVRGLETLDWAPFVTTAVNDAFSGDGDVFRIFRGNGRYGADAVLSFITGDPQGIVLFRLDEF